MHSATVLLCVTLQIPPWSTLLTSPYPNYPYYPLPAQSHRLHPPSPACHPISPIHQPWDSLRGRDGMDYSCFPWVPQSYLRLSSSCLSIQPQSLTWGQTDTDPVTLPVEFLVGVMWKVHARNITYFWYQEFRKGILCIHGDLGTLNFLNGIYGQWGRLFKRD